MSRWILFLIMIAVGFGLGYVYSSYVNPIDFTETEFDTLRADYQADYVLMVAEIFDTDNDLKEAVGRLTQLTLLPANEIVSNAIIFGERHGYQDTDLLKLRSLHFELKNGSLQIENAYP